MRQLNVEGPKNRSCLTERTPGDRGTDGDAVKVLAVRVLSQDSPEPTSKLPLSGSASIVTA